MNPVGWWRDRRRRARRAEMAELQHAATDWQHLRWLTVEPAERIRCTDEGHPLHVVIEGPEGGIDRGYCRCAERVYAPEEITDSQWAELSHDSDT